MPLPFVVLFPIVSSVVTISVGLGFTITRQRRIKDRTQHTEQLKRADASSLSKKTSEAKPRSYQSSLSPILNTGTKKENLPTVLSAGAFISAVLTPLAPPLRLLSLGLSLGVSVPYVRNSFGEAKQGRANVETMLTVLVVGSVCTGNALIASFLLFGDRATRHLLEFTEDNTRADVSHYFGIEERSAWVIQDGIEIEIPLTDLGAGDIVLVRSGDTIPIDGLVTEGSALVDLRLLFGEEDPAPRTQGDEVFAGTTVLQGKLYISIIHSGQDSAIYQISQLLEQTADYRSDVQRQSEQEMALLAPIALAASGGALLLAGPTVALSILTASPGVAFHFAGPFGILSALDKAVHQRILIKDGRAFEILPEIDLIIFDKTGTLTSDIPMINQVITAPGHHPDEVVELAAIAEQHQTHPIAKAIRAKAKLSDSEKIASTVHVDMGMGLAAEIEGRKVVVGSRRFMDALGLPVPDNFARQEAIWYEHGASAVFVGLDEQVIGVLEIQHCLRAGAVECIQQLQAEGYECWILSGDTEQVTAHIASQLGIKTYLAGRRPDEKHDIVESARQVKRRVAFVGDGINDAAALKAADISISFREATEAAADSAAILLLEPNLTAVNDIFLLAQRYKASHRFGRQVSYILPSATLLWLIATGGSPVYGLIAQNVSFWASFAAITTMSFGKRSTESTNLLNSKSVTAQPPDVDLLRSIPNLQKQ